MALTIEDTDQFWAGANYQNPNYNIPLGTKALNFFKDAATGDFRGVIINFNGSLVSVGTDNFIGDGTYTSVCWAGTSKAIYAESDGIASEVNLFVLSVSGTTISVGSAALVSTDAATLEWITVGMNTTGDKGLLWWYDGTDRWLCRFTVSGTTITPGTPQVYGGGSDFRPTDIAGVDGDRVIMAGYNSTSGKFAAQVINISSGITEGSLSDTTISNAAGTPKFRQTIRKLDTDKMIWAILPGNTIRIYTVNISGNSISSLGTELNIYPASATVIWGAIDVIDATNAILSHLRSSGGVQPKVESLTISGDTISQEGDVITLSPVGHISGAQISVASIGSGLAIVSYRGTGQTGEASGISGFAIAASASGKLWVYKTSDRGISWENKGLYV